MSRHSLLLPEVRGSHLFPPSTSGAMLHSSWRGSGMRSERQVLLHARRCAKSCRGAGKVLALRGGSESQFYQNKAGTAWSPIRSAQSLAKFFVITAGATTTAWHAHPQLLNVAAHVLHLDFKDSVTAFQTSFFSFLSLVFAIYSGNTMAFLYDRQKEMVKNLYAECMALEELLEESVHILGPDARDILAQIRLYIEEEIYHPENQAPPLGEGFALSAIRSKARNYRRAGTDVGEILQASQRLAHAQSERQATACRLLPPVHWALLYTIGSLFVSTFILFETGGSFSNEGRHILFTVLCGLMSFVLCALRDLADPAEGVYNATALLETRLSYILSMLDKYQRLPNSPARASNYLYPSSAPAPPHFEAAEATSSRDEPADGRRGQNGAGAPADGERGALANPLGLELEGSIREQLSNLADSARQLVSFGSIQGPEPEPSKEAALPFMPANAGQQQPQRGSQDTGNVQAVSQPQLASSLMQRTPPPPRTSIDVEIALLRKQNSNSSSYKKGAEQARLAMMRQGAMQTTDDL